MPEYKRLVLYQKVSFISAAAAAFNPLAKHSNHSSERNMHQGSILSTFYLKLLQWQILKAQKKLTA
jgi:hypothetical protein